MKRRWKPLLTVALCFGSSSLASPPSTAGTWAGGFWIEERCIPYILRVREDPGVPAVGATLDRIDRIQAPEPVSSVAADGDSLRIVFLGGGDDPWEFVLERDGDELTGSLVAGEYRLPALFMAMKEVDRDALEAFAGLYESEGGDRLRISADDDGTLIAHLQGEDRFQMLFPSGAGRFFGGDAPTRAAPLGVSVEFSGETLLWTDAATNSSRRYVRIEHAPPALTLTDDAIERDDLKLALARVAAGSFTMGQHRSNDELISLLGLTVPEDVTIPEPEPVRPTTLSNPFLMSRFELSNAWFAAFVEETGHMTDTERAGYGLLWNGQGFDRTPGITWRNPGVDAPANAPVVFVSWNDATAFTRWMTKRLGRVVRLPSEAEWEFACSAGATTMFSCGNDTLTLDEHAWSSRNASTTQPVGSLRPNAWGLYDMHGNVWEWCADGYGAIDAKPVVDPTGTPDSGSKLLRGGSWINGPWSLRSAYRAHEPPTMSEPHIGFRIVVEPDD